MLIPNLFDGVGIAETEDAEAAKEDAFLSSDDSIKPSN
jgi:hypothetical protein